MIYFDEQISHNLTAMQTSTKYLHASARLKCRLQKI